MAGEELERCLERRAARAEARAAARAEAEAQAQAEAEAEEAAEARGAAEAAEAAEAGGGRPLRVTVLEVGCGGNVTTVRQTSESLVTDVSRAGGVATLVRVNPELPLADGKSVRHRTLRQWRSTRGGVRGALPGGAAAAGAGANSGGLIGRASALTALFIVRATTQPRRLM